MILYIIIVVYNEYIQKTSAYISLIQNAIENNVRIVVADNSDEVIYKQNNKALGNITYVDMKGNQGISKAYNKALEKFQFGDNDWILTSDQDTTFPQGFISKVMSTIYEKKYNVIAPIVRNRNRLVSPCTISGLRFRCKEKRSFNSEEKNKEVFINSGLCYKAAFVADKHYDENMFLDFVDYDFVFQMMRDASFAPYVMDDIIVQQNFSGQSNNTVDQDLQRFRGYLADGRYFYKKWHNNNIFRNLILVLRTLKLTLRHKDKRFMQIYLE